MASHSAESVEDKSPGISETQPRVLTVNEYAELVGKWQMAYYTWQSSSITYHKYEDARSEARKFTSY